MQETLHRELQSIADDVAKEQSLLSEFSVRLLYPSLRLNLGHQQTLLKSLKEKLEAVESGRSNPILCPCVPGAYFCWDSAQLHTHEVNKQFVLHSALSSSLLAWLRLNRFQLYRFTETDDCLAVFLTRVEAGRQLVARYVTEKTRHSLQLLFLPFLSNLLEAPVTPMQSMMERSHGRPSSRGSAEKGDVTLKTFIQSANDELQLEAAFFKFISQLFLYVEWRRGVSCVEKPVDGGSEKWLYDLDRWFPVAFRTASSCCCVAAFTARSTSTRLLRSRTTCPRPIAW